MTHLPTKQSVLFAHNGLINALMILHIFSHSLLFQSCYRNQMNVGPFEGLLNVKIKTITVLAAPASFRSCFTVGESSSLHFQYPEFDLTAVT